MRELFFANRDFTLAGTGQFTGALRAREGLPRVDGPLPEPAHAALAVRLRRCARVADLDARSVRGDRVAHGLRRWSARAQLPLRAVRRADARPPAARRALHRRRRRADLAHRRSERHAGRRPGRRPAPAGLPVGPLRLAHRRRRDGRGRPRRPAHAGARTHRPHHDATCRAPAARPRCAARSPAARGRAPIRLPGHAHRRGAQLCRDVGDLRRVQRAHRVRRRLGFRLPRDEPGLAGERSAHGRDHDRRRRTDTPRRGGRVGHVRRPDDRSLQGASRRRACSAGATCGHGT